jgi:hypothetical protein
VVSRIYLRFDVRPRLARRRPGAILFLDGRLPLLLLWEATP